ncbi:hypothetical protein KKB69_00630 [Patescibacteria group bacterium]|nr:hypothetical protein [Patescibacteria group bacterium]
MTDIEKATKVRESFWRESYEKWQKILEKLSDGEMFYCSSGFSDLTVVEECGYCKGIENFKKRSVDCDLCSLRWRQVCYKVPNVRGEIVFWSFVSEMRNIFYNKKVDLEKAKDLAGKILEAIRQDGLRWGYLKE